MNKSNRLTIEFLLIVFMALVLSACKSEQSSAASAIEGYINALSNKDSVQLANLSCKAWEEQAMLEVDSLVGVGSKVANLACQESSREGSDVFVSCSGTIDLDYNGEAQQIDLSSRTYIARQEDGQWRMCGYR